jgi:hypothetical protein
MPEVITATQLRAVLGVSSGLYNDAYLNEIIETAENALRPHLQTNSVAILEHEATDNTVTVYTDIDHKFYVGQVVIITEPHGHGYSGNKTILSIPTPKSFTFIGGTTQNPVADIERHAVIPNGIAIGQGQGLDYYDQFPEVRSAVTEISVDVFNSRIAPGGVSQALDFTPGPYRMGKALYQRVAGLLSAHREVRNLVG